MEGNAPQEGIVHCTSFTAIVILKTIYHVICGLFLYRVCGSQEENNDKKSEKL